MKNLGDYMKNLYVSLDDIDESLKEKIKNLDGYRINECCEYCECPNEPKCVNTVGQLEKTVTINEFGRFNSESEIITELNMQPKVSTLYDIHNQFNKFTFIKDINRDKVEPLYFGYKEYIGGQEYVYRQNGDMPASKANPENVESLYDVPTKENKKIYKAVNDIVDSFELTCPTIQTKINGEVQVYAIKRTGTNGKENSIKSSLEEIAEILNKLDKKSEIQWSQVLDVSIDNTDDIYTFLLTFVFDIEKVRETKKI